MKLHSSKSIKRVNNHETPLTQVGGAREESSPIDPHHDRVLSPPLFGLVGHPHVQGQAVLVRLVLGL